jgi:DNA transformation protein and related proteins
MVTHAVINLAQSPGLGPKSAALLARAGVRTQRDLSKHDAAALYLQLKAMSKSVSLNMLWGIVSAQTGVPWQQVAREQRSEWLARVAALEDAQRHVRAKPMASRSPGADSEPQELESLRNIGPTVAKRLRAVGIASRKDLARVGAVKAYRLMAAQAAPHRLAVCYYLYSLAGALQNRHWDDLSQAERSALRAQTGLVL